MAKDDDVKAASAEDGQVTDETSAASGDATQSMADALQREITDLRSKLIRAQADFQNFQRRVSREVVESRQSADADFAKDLLQVLDHFDMALSVDPAKVDAKSLLDGVKITYDELRKVLGNRGIEAYDATGKNFDPHLHEAVMQEPSDKHPPMTVIQTFQKGYKMGDRVLRPAKVKVSK